MPIYRQGDVILKPVSDWKREGFTQVDECVLARGEVTGHSHRLEGNAKTYRGRNGQLMVLVEPEQEVKLVHEDHRTINIEPGVYEVARQREYSPLENRTIND